MNEEDYRAEMAKQARLTNLIAIRKLCADSASFSADINGRWMNAEIKRLAASQ